MKTVAIDSILWKTDNLEQEFSKLDHNKAWEITRADILKSLCSENIIKDILQSFSNMNKNLFTNDVQPNVVVSGAWMIKVKLFTHPFWKIRFHIRPWQSIGNSIDQIGWNCHIHDFQAFSHVLLWEIEEECYDVISMDKDSSIMYHSFLQEVAKRNILDQNSIFDILEKGLIGHNISNPIIDGFCKTNLLAPTTLAQRHTFFVGKRYKNKSWDAVETFERWWDYSFIFKGKRTIEQGCGYFLPVDQGHRISTKWDTATLFITDTTYKHWALPESGKQLVNWHGKRFPWLQKELEKRETKEYSFSEDAVFHTIKKTCKLILDTLNFNQGQDIL